MEKTKKIKIKSSVCPQVPPPSAASASPPTSAAALGPILSGKPVRPAIPQIGSQFRSDHGLPRRLCRRRPPHVKFLCSFGGNILPRPLDDLLRYVDGENRIISVPLEQREIPIDLDPTLYGFTEAVLDRKFFIDIWRMSSFLSENRPIQTRLHRIPGRPFPISTATTVAPARRSASPPQRGRARPPGRLKVVGRAEIGIDNVDLVAVTDHNHKCLVVNVPIMNTIASDEHVIALIAANVAKLLHH